MISYTTFPETLGPNTYVCCEYVCLNVIAQLVFSLISLHILSPTAAAVHSGQNEVRMDEASASHHSILPNRNCSVCGSVPGVRLQTSLERRVHRPPAGRFSGYSHSKFHSKTHCLVFDGFTIQIKLNLSYLTKIQPENIRYLWKL